MQENLRQNRYRFFLKKKRNSTNTKEKEQHAASYYITKSIDRIRPLLDLQRVRRKGRTYFIPYEINKEKSRVQAMKWLKEGSQTYTKGKSQGLPKVLSQLFIDSMRGFGYGQKKQKEQHTLAYSNRSYIRFRWW